MPDLAPWNEKRARQLIAEEVAKARAFLGDDGADQTALLPILHALQHEFGFVPPDAVPLVAERLNVSKAEVKGVVSFYSDFRTAPAGRHVVRLCRAEACQARGVDALAEHLARAHGLTPGGTAAGVTLETAYCLGACASGPAALVDESRLVGRLDVPAADALVGALKGKPA
jgi:formate dehydrogenase subunit gamma